MKQKWNEKYMYYGIMLFVVAIFLVIMLPERKKGETGRGQAPSLDAGLENL